jgi:hypothetical protein
MKEFVASVGVRWRDRNLKAGARAAARDVQGVGRAAAASSHAAERAARREGAAAQEAARRTTTFGRAVERAGTGSQRLAQRLGRATGALRATAAASTGAGKVLDGLGGRLAALTAGVGVVATVRQVGNLEERFVRLGIQANTSKDAIGQLKQQIYAVAMSDGIRLDPSELTSAVEKIVEKTGDLSLAKNNLQGLAAVIQATGSAGSDVGALFSDIKEKFGLGKALESMDLLINQGKMAAYPLRDLAQFAPRAAAAYSSLGRVGVPALREMGALLQVGFMGTGESSSASTAVEAMTRDLVANADNVQGLGVELWDEDASMKAGRKIARSVPQVLNEILAATDNDISQLQASQIFSDESLKIMRVLTGEEGRKKFQALLEVKGDGKAVTADAEQVSKTFNKSMELMMAAWSRFADSRLTAPISELAGLVDKLGAGGADTLFTGLTTAAGVVGSLVVGRKLYKGVQTVRGWFGKGGAAAAGGLAGAAGAAGIMDVRVVNWPGGGGLADVGEFGRSRARSRRGRAAGAGGGAIAATTRGTGRVSRLFGEGAIARTLRGGGGLLGKGGRLLGKAFRPLAAVMGIADIASAATSGERGALGGAVGRVGGGALGATLGGLVGSVVPGFGTVIGATLGGALGDWLGEKAGTAVSDAVEGGAQPAAQAAAGPVTIHVHPSEGMNEEALADRVARKVERRMDPSERLYD